MPEVLRSPDPIEPSLLPRPGGGYRRMAHLSARDAAAWSALAGQVAGWIEPRLSSRVLANRTVAGRLGWRLEPVGPALNRARTMARDLARTARVFLRTDVASFYPSVTPGLLHRTLMPVGVDAEDARGAARALDSWGSHGYAGLPIGPPGSAVLANAVLAPIDEALARLPFLRWVDDYLVAIPSERVAAEALDRLEVALDGLGLKRSEAKTHLVESAEGWLRPVSANDR